MALIRSLPKAIRRGLVPAPDTAAKVASELEFGIGSGCSGDGTIRLDLDDDDSIRDANNDPLGRGEARTVGRDRHRSTPGSPGMTIPKFGAG